MDTLRPPTYRRRLDELVLELDAIVSVPSGIAHVSEQIGRALEPYLGDPHLLLPNQCQTNPLRYHPNVVHCDPDERFSIVALAWLPGQETPIHDHRDFCVVGVHQGVEVETRFHLVETDDGLALTTAGISLNETGSVAVLNPPGVLHKVINPGPTIAISIHIYPGSYERYGSIRRVYSQPILK